MLERELGRGNQGVVYLARRDGGAPMALKVLLEELVDEESKERFARETSIARRLDHPGIVRALDAGRIAGRAYYAMELCPGPTLERRLEELPRGMPPDEAGRLVAEVARAAHAAHELGVVHRDLKPANIILSEPDGWPKITDFGLAHDAGRLKALTRTGDRLGTPLTMAPEQLRGEREVDRRADVHALGAILYRCLTGRHAREAGSLAELVKLAELGAPPAPPSRHNPAVWPALDAVVLSALGRERSQRPPTAAAFADAIEAALDAVPPPRSGRPLLLLVAGALLAAGTAAAVGLRATAPSVEGPTPVVPPPEAEPSPGRVTEARPATEAPPAPVGREEPRVPIDRPAPDEQLATGVAAIVELFQSEPGKKRDDVIERGTDLAPRLAHDYPDDLRAQALGSTVHLLVSGTGDGLAIRRQFARARRTSPPPDDELMAAGARMCLELGFQRAALDLASAAVGPDGAARSPWAAQTLMLISTVTEAPLRDLARAEQAGLASIAALAGRAGPELPPRHDTLSQVMHLRLAAGDRRGALARLDEARAAGPPGLRDYLDHQRLEIEAGRLDGFDPANAVGISFGTGMRLRALNGRWTAGRRDARTATAYDGHAGELERRREYPEAALVLLAAAVAWRGAGDRLAAARSVERAAALPVDPTRDGDVVGLVQVERARVLLEVDEPQAAEEAALRATVPWPSVDEDLRTPGERADAWTLVGRARFRRADMAGAREAATRAAHELSVRGGWDRRELEALQGDVR